MTCPCEELAGNDVVVSHVCIGNLWMFKDLAPRELQMLAGNAMRRQMKKGQTIFYQGDDSMEMFLLKSGRVKLSKILETGTEITLDIRGAGDFIGENMLSEELEYPVNAVCLEDTLTCGFSKSQFEEIVLQYPNVGLQVIRNMSERISLLTERVGSMATSSIEEKLYSALRHVATRHGVTESNGVKIQFPLTHEELSFLIGAHRVSITRAMKYLKETGKVVENGKHLIVTDIQS
jgi:CRP/FNR family transcriptional regulator, cyclic AMP receptor protein